MLSDPTWSGFFIAEPLAGKQGLIVRTGLALPSL
jgi:hypothetical protein